MMPPLLRLLLSQPGLLADHADAYAELLGAELAVASRAYKRTGLIRGAQLCCCAVAAALAGGALMLWAVTPEPTARALWIFWMTPGLPLLGALGCQWALRTRSDERLFDSVRRQLKADMAMLNEASAP
jgi:uncharacterized membrane protein YqjE